MDKKTLTRIALLVGLPIIFFGTGWAVLSSMEGWLGVILWVVIAVPLCLAAEFMMRQKRSTPRSARSLPRMQVRAPVRGDPERSRPATRPREPDFPWADDQPSKRRRRNYAR